MFKKIIKKAFIFIFIFLFTILFFNLYEQKRVEALEMPEKVVVKYNATFNDDSSTTYTHQHSIYYEYFATNIVDTTGHISIISPSSSLSNPTLAKFYKQPNKVTEDVIANTVGPNKGKTVSKEYDLILTGWKMTSVTYGGKTYTEKTSGVPHTENIGHVYAQNGYINIFPGVEGFTFEAVYGRAIYVQSPYKTMHYNQWFCFKYGENLTGSDDENFGTSETDTVSTFRRAYELINESTELTVYDSIFVLCGRQYEVHRYTEKQSGNDNYDYQTIRDNYSMGTYQNYYFSKMNKVIVNRTTGQIQTSIGTSVNSCVFGLNPSNYKPVTITSLPGVQYELVMHATRYDFYVTSSLRFDNVLGRFVADSEREIGVNNPRSYQLNFGNNYKSTFEATENFASNSNVNIRIYDSPSVIINGGKWGVNITNGFSGFSTLDSTGYSKVEKGTNGKSLTIKLGYFEKGKISFGGKAIISAFVLGVFTNSSSSTGSHISLVNIPDIEINGGKITTMSLTGKCIGSNIGGFNVDDGNLSPRPDEKEDLNIRVNGGYIETFYGADTGSLNGDVNLDVIGGVFNNIYSGGKSYVAEVMGDVNLNMDNALVTSNIYGGGYGGLVDGNVNMNISNSTINNTIYGSGKGTVDTFEQYIVAFNNGSSESALNTFNARARDYAYDGSTTNNVYYYMDNLTDNPIDYAPRGFPYYNVEENEYVTRVYHQSQQSSDQSYVRLIAIKQKLSLSEVTGDISINLDSVTAKTVYGGGSIAKVEGNIDINVIGASKIQNLFGACDGSEEIAKVALYAPIDQDDYVEHTFPDKGKTKSTQNDKNPLIGSFELLNDEDVLAIGGIYDGLNKVIYNHDGSKTPFASYHNQDVINRLVSKYGTQQILYVANSGDFADVKGHVQIHVDCDPVYENGDQTYNVNTLYGGNNSAGEVLGNGAPENVTHSELKGYAGSAVTINIKNGIFYTIYGGSNKSNCNYVSNVLLEGGRVFYVYGGCNQANIVGTAVEVINTRVVQALYGGNNNSGLITGTSNVSVSGTSNIGKVYGGSNLASNESTTNVFIDSGTITEVYGGSNSADISATNVVINNGTIASVYGGNNNSGNVAKSSNIIVNGGKISSALYGGGNLAGNNFNTNILVNNGTINQLYGGGNNGDVNNTDIKLYGGTISTNVHGGGNAGKANDTNLLIDGISISGDVYGGGYAGSVNSVEINLTSGSIGKSLYGGGYQGATNESLININNGTIAENIYGGGNAGETKSATVNVNGATISGTVYGAGLGATSTTTNVTLNIKSQVNDVYGGGYAGSAGTVEVNLNEGSTVQNVYGGGYKGHTTNTTLTVDGATIKENLYGGGNAGETNSATTNINNVSITGTTGTVYGAGYGATSHTKNVILNINSTVKDVYGGGYAGSAETVQVNLNVGTVANNVYGGGYEGYTKTTTVTVDGATIKENLYGGGNAGETNSATTNIKNVSITGTTGTVYGAGYGATSHTKNVILNINSTVKDVYGGGYAGSAETVQVNLNVGTVANNVYGGGYEGYTKTTTVTVDGATIKENLYGGGNAGETNSATTNINDVSITGTTGTVYGAGYGATSHTKNVILNIKSTVKDVYGGGFAGSAETVHVNLNVGTVANNVYGGGYEGYTKTTTVIVDGATINENLYGGGNAGETDSATVNINDVSITGTVYGAGYGANSNTDHVLVNIKTTVNDVYGGGFAGSAGNVEVNISSGATLDSIYGGGFKGYTNKTVVDILNSTINDDIYGGGNAGETASTTVNITDSTLNGNVYGAGLGATSHTENVTVNIYSNANTIYGGGNAGSAGTTNVNIYKGTINNSIYGGGYVGVATQTNVLISDESHLRQILINGSVFGGGEGSKASVYEGTKVEVNLLTNISVNEELEDISDISGISNVSATLKGAHSKILGSVYGGGDLGQVGQGVINAVNNTATIDQESTVIVTIKDGVIEGSVFGGGNGTPLDPSTYTVDMGSIFGSTQTYVYRGYIYGNVYGGGKQSRLYSSSQATNVSIVQQDEDDTIVIGGSVFGGGDRGSATATNASVPTTIGDASVLIENKTSLYANIYFINGGVYGDGNFCLVRGYRSIEMINFTTKKEGKLKTFFSLQRADEVILDNTDIVLKGARDLVDEEDNDLYSINRIGIINFINGSTIKLVNIVKYLEAIESDFYGFYYENETKKYYNKRTFINNGHNGTNNYNSSYEIDELKEDEIKAYNSGDDSDLLNYICVANGLYLEIRNEDETYGSVVGLFGLELLRANEGEGGGFVYSNILTSTGDFVCNTKLSSDPDVYMNVVDNVGGLNNVTHQYRYYYWYIEGANISYEFNVSGYIGSEEYLYFDQSIVPTTDLSISYVLKSINSTKLQTLLDNETYVLTTDAFNLSGKEIAIEVCIGGVSFGFISYEDGNLYLNNKSGYGDNQHDVIDNILGEIQITNINNIVTINLYKSKDVNTENKNIDIEFTIELYEKRESEGVYIYDKYNKTSKFDFNLYFSIVRFVPVSSIYSGVSKQYLGPSSIEGISITSKSSFTYEYQTKYIPGAYPLASNAIESMKWILTTVCYEYYFEPNTGYYLTVRVEGNGTRTIINKTNDLVVVIDDNTNDDKRYYFMIDDDKYYFNMLEKQETSYLPKGTKITLVDLTSVATPMYFYYTCASDTTSINLLDFVQMGSKKTLSTIVNDGNSSNDPAFFKLYQENNLTRITERLIFVFDFSETTWNVSGEFSGFITLEHIYNEHDILDYVSSNEEVINDIVHVTYNRVTPKGEKFNVSMTASGIGDFNASFVEDKYEEKESAELTITLEQQSAFINTQIEKGRIGVIISMKGGSKLPDGIVFVYDNNFYPAYGNMHVAIPLVNYGEHTIVISNLLGTLGQHDNGTNQFFSEFNVELCNLPNARYFQKIDFTSNENITSASVEVIKQEDYSIRVSSDNRIIDNNIFNFTIESNSVTSLDVEVYVNGKLVALKDIFKRYTQNVTTGEYSWTLVDDITPGVYQLKFSNKLEEEYISFIVPDEDYQSRDN